MQRVIHVSSEPPNTCGALRHVHPLRHIYNPCIGFATHRGLGARTVLRKFPTPMKMSSAPARATPRLPRRSLSCASGSSHPSGDITARNVPLSMHAPATTCTRCCISPHAPRMYSSLGDQQQRVQQVAAVPPEGFFLMMMMMMVVVVMMI